MEELLGSSLVDLVSAAVVLPISTETARIISSHHDIRLCQVDSAGNSLLSRVWAPASLRGVVMSQESSDDPWLQLLEQRPESPACNPAEVTRRRSRSPARSQEELQIHPGPSGSWSEADEVSRLNIIQPTPDDDEEWQRRLLLTRFQQAQRAERARAEAALLDAGPPALLQASGPVVQRSQWSAMQASSAAAAAASRACRDLFGSSSSVFYHGALMSYYLRGSVASHDLVKSLADSLPAHLQSVAAAQLRRLSQAPGIRLMPVTVDVACDVEARVAQRLSSGPVVQFYVGITEQPLARFAQHNKNGFDQLWLYVFRTSAESGAAERASISRLKQYEQCLNVGSGNERASHGQPHFMYVAWRPMTKLTRKAADI